MKGKKVDLDFVSSFIESCIAKNISKSEDIADLAISQISEIDEQLKQIENLKLKRSKLLDVVDVFSKKEKHLVINKEILNLFKITDKNIANLICSVIRKSPLNIENLNTLKFKNEDILFTIKNLLQQEVVIDIDGAIHPGKMYDNYIKYVFNKA